MWTFLSRHVLIVEVTKSIMTADKVVLYRWKKWQCYTKCFARFSSAKCVGEIHYSGSVCCGINSKCMRWLYMSICCRLKVTPNCNNAHRSHHPCLKVIVSVTYSIQILDLFKCFIYLWWNSILHVKGCQPRGCTYYWIRHRYCRWLISRRLVDHSWPISQGTYIDTLHYNIHDLYCYIML